eukprot:11302572-Alexandrium_andersonii.AAC.1
MVSMAERLAHEARWKGPAHAGGDDDLLDEFPDAHALGQHPDEPSALQAAWVFWMVPPAGRMPVRHPAEA